MFLFLITTLLLGIIIFLIRALKRSIDRELVLAIALRQMYEHSPELQSAVAHLHQDLDNYLLLEANRNANLN